MSREKPQILQCDATERLDQQFGIGVAVMYFDEEMTQAPLDAIMRRSGVEQSLMLVREGERFRPRRFEIDSQRGGFEPIIHGHAILHISQARLSASGAPRTHPAACREFRQIIPIFPPRTRIRARTPARGRVLPTCRRAGIGVRIIRMLLSWRNPATSCIPSDTFPRR